MNNDIWLSGPPFDEEEEAEWTVSEWTEQRDEIADAQDWWDNMMEDRRISNR